MLPASLRGWRVAVSVEDKLVTLGSVARSIRALSPVITPPGEGVYTLTIQGPRGAVRTIRIVVMPA